MNQLLSIRMLLCPLSGAMNFHNNRYFKISMLLSVEINDQIFFSIGQQGMEWVDGIFEGCRTAVKTGQNKYVDGVNDFN